MTEECGLHIKPAFQVNNNQNKSNVNKDKNDNANRNTYNHYDRPKSTVARSSCQRFLAYAAMLKGCLCSPAH